MPPLIRFVISNFLTGFLLGSAAALALMAASALPSYEPLAVWLQVFALGAPFGLGFLSTALFLDVED